MEDPVRSARGFGLRRPLVTFGYAATAAALLTVLCVVPRQDVARQVEHTEQVAAALASKAPPCFGAQARDPRVKNCPNPALADTVVPSPEAAKDDFPDDGRCQAPLTADPIRPCRFGDPAPRSAAPRRDRRLPRPGADDDAQPLVDAGVVTADAYLASGCPWSTAPPNPTSPYLAACAEFRRKLYPMLDEKATDYDAILTTGRLTVMIGDHEKVVSGLARGVAPGHPSGRARARAARQPAGRRRGREPAVLPRRGAGLARPTRRARSTGTTSWTAGSTR